MEWVQGTPLYAWAEQHAPSPRQVCLLLAQLARALEAVHAAGAVHRDVMGQYPPPLEVKQDEQGSSRAEDGRIAYRMKHPLPDGTSCHSRARWLH